MRARAEVLVCGCLADDLATLRSATGPGGPTLLAVDNPVKVAHHAAANCPVAVVLGASVDTLPILDVIPVIRAIKSDLPVIVIAAEDSLQLERMARQKGIFYYFVHPVDRSEVRAVMEDVMRCARN